MKTHWIKWERHTCMVTTCCERRGFPIEGQPNTYRAIVEKLNAFMTASDKLEEVDCQACIKKSLA